MKKLWIVLINALIMVGIMGFVGIYVTRNSTESYARNVDTFEDMTMAMEKVTENYLEGEQRICDVWAEYIVNAGLNMQDAIQFIRDSHVLPSISVHLIYTDDGSYAGLSTRANITDKNNYTVSYKNLDLVADIREAPIGQGINITRSYTNPVNGVQSIAFCNTVSLVDEDGITPRKGLLLRVIPVAELEEKWVFPQEDFENAAFAIVDSEGNYIIKDRSYKNNNFLEFYSSYNTATNADIAALKHELTHGDGSFLMNNAREQQALIAYTAVGSTDGWVFLSYILTKDLNGESVDWLLIMGVSIALALLFVFDMLFMLRLNRKLQQAAREADSANKAKTDFLSTMSHDIRTPMNAVIGLTTIAEKNIDDTEAVKECLRKISLSSNHLLTLINDILDISKVESGKLTLSPLTFSIVETAENLVNLSQPMIKEKDIDFSFHINGMDREYLYADQLRLNQIFINILSNAIKYTEPRGKVCVDMTEHETEPGVVTLTYIVADTGIGMTPEFMAKMYQPFSRQTDSRVNTIQGTGLGLAITKQMVDLMGGTIDCQSQSGVGTTFTVKLPIPIADRQLDDMKLDPIDVLVVDDDEILLETAKDALISLGANVDTATSGEEAIGMTVSRHSMGKDYSVVILDWKMPGLSGVDVAHKIRFEEQIDVPILIISAYDWSDIEEQARAAGANGFVSKPLFRSTLYDKINELLGVTRKSVEPEEDNTDIQGMNILVAEDNDINWEIINAIMGMYSINCQRAENGQICVDTLTAAPPDAFDLVFMDIQMPVMNGLQATRAIRALNGCWASGIPIIAMTADAFSENVAECFSAGMNGHIAKPIDVKLVLKEIRRIREEKKS